MKKRNVIFGILVARYLTRPIVKAYAELNYLRGKAAEAEKNKEPERNFVYGPQDDFEEALAAKKKEKAEEKYKLRVNTQSECNEIRPLRVIMNKYLDHIQLIFETSDKAENFLKTFRSVMWESNRITKAEVLGMINHNIKSTDNEFEWVNFYPYGYKACPEGYSVDLPFPEKKIPSESESIEDEFIYIGTLGKWGDFVLVFRTESSAVEAIQEMCHILEEEGKVSLSKVYDMVGKPSSYTIDHYNGWTDLTLATVKVYPGGYAVYLPMPKPFATEPELTPTTTGNTEITDVWYEELMFKSIEAAENLLDRLDSMLFEYGYVSLYDLKEILSIPTLDGDDQRRFTSLETARIIPTPNDNEYILQLPKLSKLEEAK